MATVTFDADKGVYTAYAASDSQPFSGYTVSYDPATEEFSCECPSFRYSRYRHCKHVSRVGGEITSYVDSLDRETVFESSFRGPQPDAAVTVDLGDVEYNVVLNDGPETVLPAPVVDWLVKTIRPGDELVIQRR